jgi:hypothetical protein
MLLSTWLKGVDAPVSGQNIKIKKQLMRIKLQFGGIIKTDATRFFGVKHLFMRLLKIDIFTDFRPDKATPTKW